MFQNGGRPKFKNIHSSRIVVLLKGTNDNIIKQSSLVFTTTKLFDQVARKSERDFKFPAVALVSSLVDDCQRRVTRI